MSDEHHQKFARLLKDAVPPVPQTELERDLWPQMLRRMDQKAPRVSVWDWAAAALLLAGCLLIPGMIPVLFYQL
jgi:hypothetical protein